jgi:hypothetical protein
MTIDYLESELSALEVRVNQDIFKHFGEVNYKKLMDASGTYDDDYLGTEARLNCAHAVAGLIAARTALNERNIEGTLYAMKHVTHFWSLVFGFEQQKLRLDNVSSKGGGAKRGYESPIKQYIRKACKELCLDKLPIKQAATRIAELFANGDELDIYHLGEICPIEVIGYDRDTGTLSYFDRRAPDKQKSPIDDKRLQKLIREIREPKKSE